MSILDYRAKRASVFAVCRITLPAVSGAIFIKDITPPSPTGPWAVAGNGLGLPPPLAPLQDGPALVGRLGDHPGARVRAEIQNSSKALAATFIYSFTFTAGAVFPGTAKEKREN